MIQTQVRDIRQQQEEIISEFAELPEWTDKYEYLVDLGKQLSPIAEEYRTEAYLVKGCQSRVWLHGDVKEGRLFLQADSDAVITKGIIALLIRVLSGQKLDAIRNTDLHFIESIGLKSHLSPTRSNGLVSMVRHIKSLAERHDNTSSAISESPTAADKKSRLIAELKKVYDPEIPVDIYELGLIYALELDDTGIVRIEMTLTSPACPVAGSLPLEVQEKLLALDFVNDVDLTLVWDPPWNKDRMSDEARMALDMF